MSLPKTESSHITLPATETSLSSGGSGKTAVSRSLSDSSAVSARSERPPLKTNRSVDQMPSKAQQLLKLTLMNAHNSPHNSFNSSSMADIISNDAMKIFKQFQESGDLSFEDLNNISHQLVDSSMNDYYDLQDMSVKFLSSLGNAVPQAHSSPSSAKMAMIQEQLKRIKQEVKESEIETIVLDSSDQEVETKEVAVEVKHNGSGDSATIKSPAKSNTEYKEEPAECNGNIDTPELEGLLENLRSVINEGNRDEAKKHLQRLNEMLHKKEPSVPKISNTLAVQPIVRQATFEIDPETGKRRYHSVEEQTPSEKNEPKRTENEDLVEKLTQLLGNQSLGINALNLDALGGTGAQIFVVVPPVVTAETPARPACRRSMSLSVPQKTKSALEAKKVATPMKKTLPSSRLSAFTAPRPQPAPAAAQKTSLQARVGIARKSLMGPVEKSPMVTASTSKANPRVSVVGRRMSTAKLSATPAVPTIQTTKPSPPKQIRPATGAPYAATTRRMSHLPATPSRPSSTVKVTPSSSLKSTPASASRLRPTTELKKPAVSQFKAPSVVRKATAAAKEK